MRRFAAISICAAAVFLWAAAPAVAHDGEKPAQAHILNCMGPSGHHAYMKETVCPLGKEKFQSLAMGVFSTFGTQLDGMPVSYLPLPPPLPVCPSNGFVIAEKDYSAEDLADIERVVTSQAYRDLYKEKHASFYLHAQIQKMLGRDVADYWYPLVIATWEAHQCGDRQKYRLYAESALEAAMQRLADLQQSVPEYKNRPEYWRLNILIPNFHRRMAEPPGQRHSGGCSRRRICRLGDDAPDRRD